MSLQCTERPVRRRLAVEMQEANLVMGAAQGTVTAAVVRRKGAIDSKERC